MINKYKKNKNGNVYIFIFHNVFNLESILQAFENGIGYFYC